MGDRIMEARIMKKNGPIILSLMILSPCLAEMSEQSCLVNNLERLFHARSRGAEWVTGS